MHRESKGVNGDYAVSVSPVWVLSHPMCKHKSGMQSPITSNCRFSEDRKKEAVRVLTIDLADVFLGSNDVRPTAQTCRNAEKLHGVLQRAAWRLSEHAPIWMFAPILRRVHQDPAAEAEQFYAMHHAKTGGPPDTMLVLTLKSETFNIFTLHLHA